LDGKFAAFDFAQRATRFVGDLEAREIFELAFEITEGGSLRHVKMGSPTGEVTGKGVGLGGGMEEEGTGGGFEAAEEAVEAFVDAADAFEAGDGFLADIAAFVKVDGVVFEAGFLGEGVFGEFAAPEGKAVEDAEEFDFGGGELLEMGGFFGGVVAGEVEAGDGEGSKLVPSSATEIGGR
jgi:hypothetical protein